ncbi:MAG: daunorubicin resistance protein DrrA family ABC transporter ATP-binding protein [Candidatus Promineifilaceae bacterium]
MNAIQIENLTRSYQFTTGVVRRTKKEVVALNEVSFAIKPGELFGLLGPNGAGKTTLTKILATILTPTSGKALISGLDVVTEAAKIRAKIGIVFGGERGLYWRLSGRQNVEYFATLYQVPPAVAQKRIPETLKLVGLQDRADERVEGYSRGMKQRVHIARSLVHDPEIILLDEPTIGLDPVAAREIRQVIRQLKEKGKTIFLTSHYMFEVDALCDRVAVMKKGKLLTMDTTAALKRLVADLEIVEIECLGAPLELIANLKQHPKLSDVKVGTRGHKQVLYLQAPNGSEMVPEFLQILNGVRIEKVITREPTLEDAYVRLVGEEAFAT